MRSIETKIYTYPELSDSAKERARNDAAVNWGYSWGDDALESLKALALHFGGRMTNWSIDWWNSTYSSAEFEMPEREESAHDEDNMSKREWEKSIREKLLALGSYNPKTLKGDGECKLTGYCADEDAIDGFRRAFLRDGERDLGALMDAAFDSWLKAAQSDAEYQFSDEAFAESCEANGYEFHEDGKLA